MSLNTQTLVERYLGEASDAHYVVLMCPEPRRRGIAAALALHSTLRDMLAVQPDVLPTKVTWWHEELARLRAGDAVHPLSQSLLAAVSGAAEPGLHDALDALLHGAVMDANRIAVTPDTLDDYLRMRCGGLHVVFGQLLGTTDSDSALAAATRLHGIAQLVLESRDPRFAERPNATLELGASTDDAALLATLTEIFHAAASELDKAPPINVASSVHIALVRRAWPRILGSTPGQVVPPERPWRTLLCAWRAARRARRAS